MARSGTRGEHVTVLGSFNEGYIPPQETAYVARVLRSLGYRTSVRLIGIQSDSQALERQFAMNTDGDWIADYPDPSSYIPPFLACHGDNNPGYFCDPALDREMRRAQSLELAAPRSADALWSRVDRTMTDHAFWVPTVTPRQVDYVAKQVRDYQFNPVWAFLLDQSWVH